MATIAKQQTTTSVETLIEAAFAQLKQMGAGAEASTLFPNGLENLELEVNSSDGARVSLKLATGPSAATSGVDDNFHILLDTDVVPTFNAEGHKVIALIAQEDLTAHFPNTWKKVQKVLDNGNRALLDAAIFPDSVLRTTHPETKPLHFIDIVFTAGAPNNPPPPLPPPPHILTKIAESTATLKAGGSTQLLVDELSWLIHLIGDVHQPLHCTTHVTPAHPAPQGDRGGNSFKLKGMPNNLHSVWDSSVSFQHNLDDLSLAQSIMQEHTRQKLAADLLITDAEKWARNSFNLAKQFAYGPLTENPASPPKLTAAYLKQTEKIGRKQAALAGYRLADRLKNIFG